MSANKPFCLALDRQADRIHVSKQLWVNTAPSGWNPHILFQKGETEARRGLRQDGAMLEIGLPQPPGGAVGSWDG